MYGYMLSQAPLVFHYLERSPPPLISQVVTLKDILHGAPQSSDCQSATNKRPDLYSLSGSSSCIYSSMPGQLITEVSPAGKWTERLWEAGKDERQFEKSKLCLDLICSM
ncbi:hypothetical protein ATANTOWER_016822 [Ataeniobius toweri]|uniref:Uncharacterized protein n=1 Tax=Ataeniobius toweri TaxID=208326 RepID=A0ABU7BZ26_9TELE|nr:hypothetical protein [Ataeniobius toweri]